MENYEKIIGLTPKEAEGVYPEIETIRVTMKDGKHLGVTDDYWTNRLNVAIKDGKIDEILGIG